jgi:DNA-binding transcriptional LysR family regulator
VSIDPTSLDLNLLVALDRLLATESVSDAARALCVTQPAMSRTLARLRESLGDPLFVREGRKLVATDRARALREPVAEALRAASAVFTRPEAFDPKTAAGEFRLALGDEAQTAFAEPILTALWRELPRLDIRIHRLMRETVADARRGAIELAVAPDLSALPPIAGGVDLSEFVQRKLYDRRFVVVSSRDHPRRRLDLEAYARADHLLVGPDATGRGFVDDYLESHGLRRRVAATVTSFHTAAYVVARTKLISTLPEEVVATSQVKLVVAKPPLALPAIPMVLLWLPRHTNDARHRFVRGLIERAVRSRLER